MKSGSARAVAAPASERHEHGAGRIAAGAQDAGAGHADREEDVDRQRQDEEARGGVERFALGSEQVQDLDPERQGGERGPEPEQAGQHEAGRGRSPREVAVPAADGDRNHRPDADHHPHVEREGEEQHLRHQAHGGAPRIAVGHRDVEHRHEIDEEDRHEAHGRGQGHQGHVTQDRSLSEGGPDDRPGRLRHVGFRRSTT